MHSDQTFASRIMDYTEKLRPDWPVPDDVEILYPYDQEDTLRCMHTFYRTYYADKKRRIFLFGINPGRFGAGVTGVPFTDPIRLVERCGIDNPFPKRAELSSIFVYEFIDAFGGEAAFFENFCLSSLSPLGFIKDGKNYNYYDDKTLQAAVEPYILDYLKDLLSFGAKPQVALCMGRGKNYQFFQHFNEQHQLFEQVIPLPHPRWVMQYRRKRMDEFTQEYVEALRQALRSS